MKCDLCPNTSEQGTGNYVELPVAEGEPRKVWLCSPCYDKLVEDWTALGWKLPKIIERFEGEK